MTPSRADGQWARWLHKGDCTTARTAKYNKLSRSVCHADGVYRTGSLSKRFPRVRSSAMRLATALRHMSTRNCSQLGKRNRDNTQLYLLFHFFFSFWSNPSSHFRRNLLTRSNTSRTCIFAERDECGRTARCSDDPTLRLARREIKSGSPGLIDTGARCSVKSSIIIFVAVGGYRGTREYAGRGAILCHNSATETVRNFMGTGVYSTVYRNGDISSAFFRDYDERPTEAREKKSLILRE